MPDYLLGYPKEDINEALGKVVNIDSTPTTDSTNAVTSGGVKAYVDENAGSGDVVGPGSATDNAIALFDTTTGKLIKDSATLISDLIAKSLFSVAKSIIVQQSGTGSPEVLQVGNSTIIGRTSGASSNVAALTASQVKEILLTTIQEVYNSSDAGTIITDETRGALKFQGGTGNDNDDVIQVLNNAGTVVGYIDGNGLMQFDTIAAVSSFTTTNATMNAAGYVEGRQFGQLEQTITSSGGTAAWNLANGGSGKITLTENTTITLSNPPSSGRAGTFTLEVTQGAGAYTLAITGVKWAGGTPPTITATNGAKDVITLIYTNGAYYGSILQAFA